jgi:nicotinate-nucleotide--dimethylbenzimidazole phosphoribosyltransferase
MTSATAPAPVDPPDPDLADEARERLTTLAAGPDALGELAELAVWATSVRGGCPPPPFGRIRALLLAADHGVAHAPSLPAVRALLEGAGPQALLARTVGVEVRVVDVGLDLDPDVDKVPGAGDHRIRRGSGALDREDALTFEEVIAAVALGRQLVDEEVDSGADLLIPAAVGVDAALPATAMIATISRTEPIWALGFGRIRDDAEWSRWCRVIRDARRRTRDHAEDPYLLLSAVGGADLAALTGVLLQAAVRRTPVLLDGTVGAAAGLLARDLAPDAPLWWRAPQRTGAEAERTALEMLQLAPVVPLGLRLGEGCGALVAVPLLRTAVAAFGELTSAVEHEPDDAGSGEPGAGEPGAGEPAAGEPGPELVEEWPAGGEPLGHAVDGAAGGREPAADPVSPRDA